MWEAIGVSVAALLGLLGSVLKLRHERRKAAPERAIRDHGDVYDILAPLCYKLRARRVVVVKTHNGGGIPSAKTPLYSTALYEVAGEGTRPLKYDWQGQPVDGDYVRVLNELLESGSASIAVDALAPGATLRALYEVAAIESVEKHYLCHDTLGLYYLSLQWDERGYEPSPADVVAIRAAIPRIKAILANT